MPLILMHAAQTVCCVAVNIIKSVKNFVFSTMTRRWRRKKKTWLNTQRKMRTGLPEGLKKIKSH